MVAAGLPRTPGAEVRGVPRQGGTGPGREQLRPRTQRSRREWECEGKEAAGEKREIIRTGNAAKTRAQRRPEAPPATPLALRPPLQPPPPPPPRSAARRHSSGGGAPSPRRPASPGGGLTLRRAAAPARPRRRRVHGQRLRRSSPARAPAVPQRFLPLRISRLLLLFLPGVAGSPRSPLGLLAAQRRCPPGIARRAPGWVPALSASLLRGWFGPPSLAPSEPRLPSSGTAVAAARSPARPLPPA